MKSTIWSLEAARKKHRHSPGLAQALATLLPPGEPVLDLGCGRGFYLNALAGQGLRCLGIEGTKGIQEVALFPDVREADLAQPLKIDWPRSNLLCLEVAEHLHAAQEATLLDTIERYCLNWLVISWAIPGQRGHGHVNCRPNSYVYCKLHERGFQFVPAATFTLREAAEDHVKYFRNSLLVFSRNLDKQ